MVGDKGGRLSGGQIQRIAIARALIRNAPILILDEATSALDAESEASIQTALQNLIRDKTVFIIAHRFSTIAFATRILVFEDGRIIADGMHEELLRSCPLYKRLHDSQK
jgi:ABC-type multidrug transport system fused ATPase/permease subunit